MTGMQSSRRWAGWLSTALALMVISQASCAGERTPINRVQANALAKSFFVGDIVDPSDDPEFYMRTSVVDVAVGAGADGLFTSSDAMPVTRIRWEITEDLLVARLTYELIEDTDYAGVGRTETGQIVAAYAIESHFDIRREYNPSTGEELNVILENSDDRPWAQRTYFRVDWSRNLVTTAYDLDTLSQLGIYYGVTWSPVAYYVSDPAHEDAPQFDLERGYFDVTNKAYADPGVIEDEYWGDFPACWLIGYWPSASCNPSELTLRQAFLRVQDTDYEPIHHDGIQADMFGFFTVDRQGYDRGYGVVDDKWNRFAARWNLYPRSHAEPTVPCNTPETTPVGGDPHRDDDNNGTEDECEAVGRGSRCDAFVGECTLPLRDRAVKTIAWHVNRTFPSELFEGTAEAVKAWSDALRVAVLAGRLAECRRTGEAGCEQTMGWPQPWSDDYVPPLGAASPAEVPEIMVLCHNPVDPEAGDDESVCGPAGTSPRLGDLRYHLLSVHQDPEIMSPWGIMMDAWDPLTGEAISGNTNVWGATTDRAAATLVDLLGLLNGEIAPDAFIKGENISDWVAANQLGGVAERGAPAMSREEIETRQRALDPAVIERFLAGIATPAAHAKKPQVRRAARAQALVDSGRLGPGNAVLSARLRQLRGTALEGAMVSPEVAQAVGHDPTAPLSAEVVGRGSPFGKLMNPTLRRSRERAMRLSQARRHACRYEAPEPDNLLGLARVAQTLFPSPNPDDPAAVQAHRADVYLWARQQFNKGVMAHEIGHSMGLRHNFTASFDALNYAPEYWQLRTGDGAVTAECEDGNTDGESCVGPRWRDPITTAEIEGNIGRYGTTSVMDYPGDQNQDMLLPGKYDRAALRFGYAGLVDVFADEGVSVDGSGAGAQEAYRLLGFTSSPGLFGVIYHPPPDPGDDYEFIHYSRYQDSFALIRDCAADATSPLATSCREKPMDVVDYRDMYDFIDDPLYAAFDYFFFRRSVDDLGRVRRGYMYSSDEYADSGNVPSFSNDAGADAYEQVRFLEGLYENRYVLDSFRRNRVSFNSWDTMVMSQYRYLDPIQLIAKTFAFGVLLDGDPTAPDDYLLQDGFYGPLAMSGTVALDLFARILTRPEPGYYCPWEFCGGVEPVGLDEDLFTADALALPEEFLYDFRVTLGDGRYLHNDYDYNQGYWWGDYQSQVGTYYDKIWASYYLGEAFDYFIGSAKEDFTDSRYKNVNFATVYPEQVRRLYNSLLTNDYQTYAPWVVAPSDPDDTPLVALSYPRWHDRDGIGTRPASAYLVDPNYAWNEQLYAMVWGAMYFPTNWSNRWVHDARIAVLPTETPDWPDVATYAFFHPATGLTYRAHSSGTEEIMGVTHQKGAGARMLEWANHLLSRAYLVERDEEDAPVLDAYGTPLLVLDGDGLPQIEDETAAAALQRYVDTIDLFRQVVATFEQPLTDDWLPQP